MKTILFTVFVLLMGATAQAQISNSQYDLRHQNLIEQASLNACQVNGGRLTQVSTSVVEEKIDQGIFDLHYTTELELTVRIDQGVYDTYKVTVKSLRMDAYDHVAQDWGIYSVESATCSQ